MAKVGTEEINHKGSGKSIFVTINFYTKNKLFQVVDFPKEIEDWHGAKITRENEYSSSVHNGIIIGESYDECVKKAKEVFNEYYNLQIKEEKIIVYKLKINNKRKNELYHAPSLTIGVDFKIMYRIYIGDEKFLSNENYERSKQPEEGTRLGGSKMYREDGNNGHYDWMKIQHTDQMEIFFINLTDNLNLMIDNISLFFGEGSENLIGNVNNQKLLM